MALTSSSTPAGSRALAAEGVFECKTCNKSFPSLQGLGGHRTSHTRLQAKLLSDPAAAAAERDRARIHECAACAGSSSPWGRRSAATCAGTGARRARRPSCSRPPTSTTRAAPPCRSRRRPCWT
uniref:C2H2 type zinc finger transcription factor ZFP21 n=1 Tax=Oryza sativa subsp. japonica TaxID=39947 RepID=Q7X9N6_ORYSJ|nr:C2H2 type zinc finger transcription factor ZFP21 [Oryza sativa Japonica Group]